MDPGDGFLALNAQWRIVFANELAGQYPEYLTLQLAVFKDGVRGGTPYAHIMRTVASRLTRDQMDAVARYYASLPPASLPPSR